MPFGHGRPPVWIPYSRGKERLLLKRYLWRRFGHSILVILGVSAVVFFVIHLTGDPAALLLPMDASPEEVARFREAMGFNDPLYLQYWYFLKKALVGNFGLSLRHQQPALAMVVERMPATLELTLGALLVALLVAVPLGVASASRRYSLVDNLGSTLGLLGQSMPVYWQGIMLILIFSVSLRWLPAAGRGGLDHLVLPAVTLGTYSAATIMRLLRSGLLEVLKQDYVRTARSKGLSERVVVYKHALRNALLPVLTVVGLQFGSLLGGAVITETVFAWPGVGRLIFQAINNRDFPLVQAAVFILALIIVTVNFLTDILYTYLDPRVRYS